MRIFAGPLRKTLEIVAEVADRKGSLLELERRQVYRLLKAYRMDGATDKLRQVDQGAVVDYKRLGAVLALIRDQQPRRGPQSRSGPRRRDQRDARLFKVG